MPAVPTLEQKKYKPFFKGGDGQLTQEVPVPLREDGLLVGFEYKKLNIATIVNMLPMYSPFTDAEDYYFDLDEMDKFIRFTIQECVFPEGVNTGLAFIPEMWQWAVYFNMFCWKHKKTNLRRYREVFIYVPRGNGKTTAFGTIPSLYMFFVEKENRAQNFCAAADIEQAAINFRHVAFNIESNPRLLTKLRGNKVHRGIKSFEHEDGSIFKVLSAIAETKHGLSPNFAYIDEVHAHRTSELIDVIITGTGKKRQPLTIYTTTADFDRPSACNDLYARAKHIAMGTITEHGFLPVVYEAQAEDDWKLITTWKKANPNFGISIYPEYFDRQVSVCLSNPSLLNRFLRLNLNVRTKVETVWIPSWVWANGCTEQFPLLSIDDLKQKIWEHKQWHNYALDPSWWSNNQTNLYLSDPVVRNYYTWYFQKLEELQYEECWGGYDNSSNNDIASFALYFPHKQVILTWFWVPAESIDRRSVEQRIPYDRWLRSGLINNTPMACISERMITEALVGGEHGLGICQYFEDIRNVAFDNWGANYIYECLYNAGVAAKSYPQSYAAMNEPIRKIETAIGNKELFHGGNPVMTWMVGNAMVAMNTNGQRRIDKFKSSDKVDGPVSMLMAMGGFIYSENNTINSLPGLKVNQDA